MRAVLRYHSILSSYIDTAASMVTLIVADYLGFITR